MCRRNEITSVTFFLQFLPKFSFVVAFIYRLFSRRGKVSSSSAWQRGGRGFEHGMKLDSFRFTKEVGGQYFSPSPVFAFSKSMDGLKIAQVKLHEKKEMMVYFSGRNYDISRYSTKPGGRINPSVV